MHFRATEPDLIVAAYTSMTQKEFDAINGRQDWANWRTIPRALSLFLISRNLERVGDHATNIAEEVIYWIKGRDIRHGHEAKVDAEPGVR